MSTPTPLFVSEPLVGKIVFIKALLDENKTQESVGRPFTLKEAKDATEDERTPTYTLVGPGGASLNLSTMYSLNDVGIVLARVERDANLLAPQGLVDAVHNASDQCDASRKAADWLERNGYPRPIPCTI